MASLALDFEVLFLSEEPSIGHVCVVKSKFRREESKKHKS